MDEQPTLSSLLSLLKEKSKLTVNSSYHHDMRHLLMSLNSSCIDSIKQEFHVNENHMGLQKFLWLLRRAIEPGADNLVIYYELTRLFEDIDIDQSNTIEWKEFLEYLSSSAWISDKYESQHQPLSHDKKMLVHAFRQDVQYRKQPIKKMIEIQRNNLLGVINRDCKTQFISISREQHKKHKEEEVIFQLQHVDSNKILSLDYAEEERLYGVLMSNRNLCFIQDGEIQKHLGVIRSAGAEIDIKYMPIHRIWALESANSTLSLFVSPKGASLDHKFVFQPHKQPLTGIQQTTSPLAICTSSLDGSIRLWQASTGKLIIQLSAKHQLSLSSQHQKGVKGIATFSKDSVSFICSWMFTSEIYLWLPSLSLSKPFSGELRGHMGLIIDCVFTWRGQLVSLDDKRGLRMWNPEKGECIQNLVVEQDAIGLFAMKSKPYLVAYSKLMDFYRMRTNSKADLQSEMVMTGKGQRNVLTRGEIPISRLISTFFSEYYSALVVVTSQQAKILQINTNILLASLLPAREDQEFIAMTSKRDRRMYLGTSKGFIYEHKIENGRNIKIIEASPLQENQLKFIYYHEETKILMAIIEGSRGSYVLTYDEETDVDQVVKQVEFDQTQLCFFQFSTLHQQFYILSEKWLTVWNYDKLIIISKVNMNYFQQRKVLSMIMEEKSSSLMLVTKNQTVLIKFDEFGKAIKSTSLQYFQHRNTITSGSLMACQVPVNHYTQLKFQDENKKRQKVNFEDPNPDHSKHQLQMMTIFILCLSNVHNQSHFFDITHELPEVLTAKHPLKGKVQRIKQKRKTYINQIEKIDITETIDFQSKYYDEKALIVPKTVQIGNVLGYFYFFCEDKGLSFFDIEGCHMGEWNLSLSKPKKWNIFFNEIENVMARLSRTELALKRILYLHPNKLMIQLLTEKYITQQELSQLRNLMKKSMKSFKTIQSSVSKKTINSKKTLKSLKQVNMSRNILNQFKISTKSMNDNPFARKLETKNMRKHHRDNSTFYQKVHQLIKMKPTGTSTPALQTVSGPQNQISPFVQHIQYLFASKTGGQVDGFLEESSVKSKKKQPKRQSVDERPHSSLTPKSPGLGSKSRIKSSLNDLAKNFVHAKIECQNFLNRNAQILHAAKASIGKRRKLKL